MEPKSYASMMRASQEPLDKYLDSLVGEDCTTYSSREQAAVDKASLHGEMYWCMVDETDETIAVTSDLGQPESKITLSVARHPALTVQQVCEALSEACSALA